MKFGAAVTVTAMGRVFIMPPPLATTFTVYLPGGVAVDGSRVRVLLPAPGATKVAGEKLPVMPTGKPLSVKDVAALKVPTSANVTATVAVEACTMDKALLATVRFKLGVTIRVSGTVRVSLNEEPPPAVIAKL